MDLKPLQEIGLTFNESRIYYELSRTGPITAGELTKRVDLHRSRTYEALDRLIKKGLVHFSTINKTKHFQAKEASVLLDLLKEKKEGIEKFMPSLEQLQEKQQARQNVEAYSGIGGIKSVLNETLKAKEYLVFGAPEQSLEIMGEVFWENYNQKLNENKIKTKMIFNEELRKWSNTIKKINISNEIKFLPKHFDNMTETFVMNDKTIIIVWSDHPTGMIINDPSVSRAYKQFFNELWKTAKP